MSKGGNMPDDITSKVSDALNETAENTQEKAALEVATVAPEK